MSYAAVVLVGPASSSFGAPDCPTSSVDETSKRLRGWRRPQPWNRFSTCFV